MQFSLLYASETYDTRTKLMGRQTAGQGFLRAALKAQPDRIWCFAASRQSAQDFANQVALFTEADTTKLPLPMLEVEDRTHAASLMGLGFFSFLSTPFLPPFSQRSTGMRDRNASNALSRSVISYTSYPSSRR